MTIFLLVGDLSQRESMVLRIIDLKLEVSNNHRLYRDMPLILNSVLHVN